MLRGILTLSGIMSLSAPLACGQGAGEAGSLAAARTLIDQYCVACHNQTQKTAGLMLDKLDLAQIGKNAETWEKVVRKLRAGMMPPQGMLRPGSAASEALTLALENELDRAATARPHLAAPGVHRSNRTEYANAIRDLLALDIDPAGFVPADDSSYGFDNVVSGLEVSPALVEGYVSAAAKIDGVDVGGRTRPCFRGSAAGRARRPRGRSIGDRDTYRKAGVGFCEQHRHLWRKRPCGSPDPHHRRPDRPAVRRPRGLARLRPRTGGGGRRRQGGFS